MMKVLFYKQENGKINFRVNGQKLPYGVEILSRGVIPDWAIKKALFYRYLYEKYGSHRSPFAAVHRCALISSFDNSQGNLILACRGTVCWGEEKYRPSDSWIEGVVLQDYLDFSVSDVDVASIRIVDDLEEWLGFVVK